jgi:hypothetical protein
MGEVVARFLARGQSWLIDLEITATLVGGALIIVGVAGEMSPRGRAGSSGLAIAGAILIAGVLIASAIPPPPRKLSRRIRWTNLPLCSRVVVA